MATGAPDERTEVIGVLGNGTTVRIPWDSLSSGFAVVATAPAEASDEGVAGQFAVSNSGLYSYENGQWGKSPRYNTNWNDLDQDTRFLLVSKIMSMSQEELAVAWQNLGLGPATGPEMGPLGVVTPGTLGLVKGSDTVQVTPAGELFVNEASTQEPGLVRLFSQEGDRSVVTKAWLDEVVEGIQNSILPTPIASPGVPGLVTPSETVSVNSLTGEATVHIAQPGDATAGLVKLSSNVNPGTAQNNYAATVAAVRVLAQQIVDDNIQYATANSPGIITPQGALQINPDRAGAVVTVRDANYTSNGVVRLLSNIPTVDEENRFETGCAPSAKAVRDYVTVLTTRPITPESLPIAGSKRGAIVASASVLVAPEGGPNAGQATVPEASATRPGIVLLHKDISESASAITAASKGYVDSQVAAAAGSVPSAGSNTKGVVKVTVKQGEYPGADGAYSVPTTEYMQQAVANSEGKWNGGTVSGATTFTGQLRVNTQASVVANTVLNKSQIEALIENAIEAHEAAKHPSQS